MSTWCWLPDSGTVTPPTLPPPPPTRVFRGRRVRILQPYEPEPFMRPFRRTPTGPIHIHTPRRRYRRFSLSSPLDVFGSSPPSSPEHYEAILPSPPPPPPQGAPDFWFNLLTQTFLEAPFSQRMTSSGNIPSHPPSFPQRVYEIGESSNTAANRGTPAAPPPEYYENRLREVEARIMGAYEFQRWEIQALMVELSMIKENARRQE